jgi:hypothetical protein
LNPIEKLPSVDPLAGQIVARKIETGDALMSMKSETLPQPATPAQAANQPPQDSIELSTAMAGRLSDELQATLELLDLPQFPALNAEAIAGGLERWLSEKTISRPGESAYPAATASPRTEVIEKNSSLPEAMGAQTKTAPVKTPVTMQSEPAAAEPLKPIHAEQAGAKQVNANASTAAPSAPKSAVNPQAGASESGPVSTLACGWIAIDSQPKSYAYLEVQRDGGRAAAPEADDAAQPHFISLDIVTPHVGVVRVRLSLLRSELVGTLGFAAPGWAEEARQALPELAAALAGGGFRTADLQAIETTS